MTYEEHLTILQCDYYSSKEDIKKSYRALCLILHPDYGGSSESFVKLKESYDYLLINHAQKIKVEQQPIKPDRFYRVLGRLDVHMTIYLPTHILTNGAEIYCMTEDTEFRIILNPGTVLPTQLLITNIAPSAVRLIIYPDHNSRRNYKDLDYV